MSKTFNPFTGTLDYVGNPLTVSATAPASSEGLMYVNSTDNTVRIYYGGTWTTLHTLAPPVYFYLQLQDGYLLLQDDSKIILN